MSEANDIRHRSQVNHRELLDEFYGSPLGHRQLGEFESMKELPRPYDVLLNHNAHMTVTVESHAKEAVDVQVHACHRHDNWYSREITLITQRSKKVVQYGIVRLDVSKLAPIVWQQIESQAMPLGRVLIQHNVLREVELCELWKVTAGPVLAERMEQPTGAELYGRTALIYCNREPAIELLEIVNLCNPKN
ncbi:MAG: hypothetical protein ISQ09_02565 [Rubripirellula sp.]|jgi:chorismate-pyruvate lyase|nr:hypothetical protein [Rubripirellula sp.]